MVGLRSIHENSMVDWLQLVNFPLFFRACTENLPITRSLAQEQIKGNNEAVVVWKLLNTYRKVFRSFGNILTSTLEACSDIAIVSIFDTAHVFNWRVCLQSGRYCWCKLVSFCSISKILHASFVFTARYCKHELPWTSLRYGVCKRWRNQQLSPGMETEELELVVRAYECIDGGNFKICHWFAHL